MRYAILGPLEVHADDGTAVRVTGARQRSLLTLLALTPGRPVAVEDLVSGQYDEHPPDGAANTIQVQISRLRRSLPPDTISFDAHRYRLAAGPDDVDACRFERLAVEGRRRLQAHDPAAAVRLLREAVGLWRGTALADVPYAQASVARLEELRLVATEDLIEAELATPDGTSVARIRELVQAHPLRERLRVLLMRALIAEGRPAEALTAYERARTLLADELGVDPSAELQQLHLQVLRADRPAPLRPPPHQGTSFVGRQQELQTLAEYADRRLVTVVGPGGAGKTRLAIEAVRERRDPVAFVDLAAIDDDRQVVPAVLSALGRREPVGGADGAGAEDRLAAALSEEQLTLLLDNGEHVLAGVAALARRLLARCAGVKMIMTSRVALGLVEEVLVPISGLAAAGRDADDDHDHPVRRQRSDAMIRLFADRAAAVSPGFTVDDASVGTVTAICEALDGLPLAIELAAARTRQFALDDLAERLVDRQRLPMLRGDPTAAARHRTLDAVVQWSWDLLEPGQQRLARRFAVFAGGADLAAIEAVCDTPEAELVVAELVDRSLLDCDGDRYRMLETVRAFCADRLREDPGEDHRTRLRHAQHFLTVAERADPHLRRAEQLDWLRRLAVEDGNLVAALAWAVDHDRPLGMRLICALAAYWWLSGRSGTAGGHAAELITTVPAEALAELAEDGLDEAYVSCVVHAVPRAADEHWTRAAELIGNRTRPLRHPFGAALWGMTVGPASTVAEDVAGDVADADVTADDVDDTAARLLGTDPWNLALGRLSRVLMGLLGGRPEREEPEMRAALHEFRALGDRWGIAQVLDWLGVLTSWRGSWAEAHASWVEALQLQNELGALEECAAILCHQAESLVREERFDDAAAAVDRAAGMLRRAGRAADSWAQFDLAFAEVARLRGDHDQANRVIRRAQAAARSGTLDVGWMAARIDTELGRLAEVDGDLERAQRHHVSAVALAAEAPFASELAHAAEGAAGVVARRDRADRAARLLGAAVALRGLAIRGDHDVAATSAAATEQLGTPGFARLFADAAALPPGAARTLVLQLVGPPDSARR